MEPLEPLELAYSPCPNDTFIFTPWVEGRIPGAPPVVERYPTHGDYTAAVRGAAETLVAERFLLAEEIDAVVAKAAADYPGAS